jgi:hypothetical protein
MITSLLTFLSSGVFGSLIGIAGGYLNRKMDLQIKKLDLEHELKVKDKDLEFMKAEYEQRTKVATIETEGATEVAGYNAMASSYSFAVPDPNTGMGKFSAFVRPFLTICFFAFSVYIYYTVSKQLSISVISGASMEKIYITLIEWILFQAGVCIGWWFANRPSKVSITGNK